MQIKFKIIAQLLLGLVLSACSTPSVHVSASGVAPSRKMASLDDNGDHHDGDFDSALEKYWGGSVSTEARQNDAVADVIRDFIDKQKKVRAEVAANPAQSGTPTATRIFRDLPKPDYATRDVHRKTNGCFKAELQVNPNLKDSLNSVISSYKGATDLETSVKVADDEALGVFASGPVYDAIVRLSNGNPGNNPDRVGDARGFAVKLLPRGTLTETPLAQDNSGALNKATVLDILTINFPTFFMNDPVRYATLNRSALEGSRDFKNKLVGQLDIFASTFITSDLNAMERRLALWVNGSVIYSPLYQEYFSMVPSRLGLPGTVRAVKYSWTPVACTNADQDRFVQESQKQWAPWTNDHTYAFPPNVPAVIKHPATPYSNSDFPDDYLRLHAVDRLKSGDFCFNFFMQLYRDPVSTSIEDSTDIWLRTETEKNWWLESVVPSQWIWNSTDSYNTETRETYVERIQKKQLAPAVLAGRLVVKKLEREDAATALGNNQTCEDLSFNPWNGDIVHHKPLGIVSRMKRKVYNASRRERHELNGIDDRNFERE